LETAAAALALPRSDTDAPRILVAALRALAQLAPARQSEALAKSAAEIACRVLEMRGASNAASTEQCRTQALQLLKALARRVPALIGQQAIVAAATASFLVSKDDAPSVDDLDDISAPALAGRDCLRTLARVAPTVVLPIVFDAAQVASQSSDAMDRAAAVHALVFSLCGAREAPSGWAAPLARALGDRAVWVRQAACEGAASLAEALRQGPVTT